MVQSMGKKGVKRSEKGGNWPANLGYGIVTALEILLAQGRAEIIPIVYQI